MGPEEREETTVFEDALADDRPVARVMLGDGTCHDGAGWYYVEDECEDEGSVGAFTTREEAVAHATEAGYRAVAADGEP